MEYVGRKLEVIPGKGVCKECGFYCGNYFCCKLWPIELSKGDIRKLVKAGYPLKKFLITKPTPRLKQIGKEKRCLFLEEDGRCEIHRKFGKQNKPYACRKFPHNKIKASKEDTDFVFYQYAGKIFTRDILMLILKNLQKCKKEDLFREFTIQIEGLKAQKDEYIDIFNYKPTKPLFTGLAIYLASLDIAEWVKIRKANIIFSKKGRYNPIFIKMLIKAIDENKFMNPDFPKTLQRFFYLLRDSEAAKPNEMIETLYSFNRRYL